MKVEEDIIKLDIIKLEDDTIANEIKFKILQVHHKFIMEMVDVIKVAMVDK